MSSAIRSLFVSGLALFAASALAASVPPAPATPRGDTVDLVQGTPVADPYRWLEDWDDPKVQAWSDAQNDRARAYVDAQPGREAIKDELTRLITSTSPAFYSLQARGKLIFALYFDPKFQQPMLVSLNEAADPDSRRTVLDPNALDAKGHFLGGLILPGFGMMLRALELGTAGLKVPTGDVVDFPTNTSDALTSGGRAADADQWVVDWLSDHPGDVRFLSYLGARALATQDYAGAQAKFAEVVRLDPDNAVAHNNLLGLHTPHHLLQA